MKAKTFEYKGIKVHYTSSQKNAVSFINADLSDGEERLPKNHNITNVYECPGTYCYVYTTNNSPYYHVIDCNVVFVTHSLENAMQYILIAVSDYREPVEYLGMRIYANRTEDCEKAKAYLDTFETKNWADKDERIFMFMGEIIHDTEEDRICPAFPYVKDNIDTLAQACEFIETRKNPKYEKYADSILDFVEYEGIDLQSFNPVDCAFSRYEVAPVRTNVDNYPLYTHLEVCAPEEAEMWSVYARLEHHEEAECIADCKTESLANFLARVLTHRLKKLG